MKLLLSFLLISLLTFSFAQSQKKQIKTNNQYQILQPVVTTGTIIGSSNNNYQQSAAAGQLAVDSIGNNLYSIYFGFWDQYPHLNPLASDEELFLPKKFELKQNYPNPFNPVTTIGYALPQLSDVTLEVYNALGQKVALLLNTKQEAGYYNIIWHGINNSGDSVSSGVYFYRIEVRTTEGNVLVKTKKMLFLK
jgi:hypothetical protein